MRPVTVSVGPNATGGTSSAWVRLDDWAQPEVSLQVSVSGTANFTVQQTLDDPNSPTNPVATGSVAWVNHPDPALVNGAASAQGNYGFKPTFVRFLLNSGTGTVTMTVAQAGGGES